MIFLFVAGFRFTIFLPEIYHIHCTWPVIFISVSWLRPGLAIRSIWSSRMSLMLLSSPFVYFIYHVLARFGVSSLHKLYGPGLFVCSVCSLQILFLLSCRVCSPSIVLIYFNIKRVSYVALPRSSICRIYCYIKHGFSHIRLLVTHDCTPGSCPHNFFRREYLCRYSLLSIDRLNSDQRVSALSPPARRILSTQHHLWESPYCSQYFMTFAFAVQLRFFLHLLFSLSLCFSF